MTDQEKVQYEALKNAGHSPIMAGQIILDAKRGDKWAIQWINKIMKPVTFRDQHKA